MEREILTLFVVGIGIASLFMRLSFVITAQLAFFVLGAAGTVSFGAASIPPANLFLLFFVGRLLVMPGAVAVMMSALRPWRSGFTLLILMSYAAMTAYFYPRLLDGVTDVFYSDRSLPESAAGFTRALQPGSGNVTQALYAVSGLAVYAAAYAYCRYGATGAFVRGVVVLALINVLFGVLDIVTYSLGASDVLSFARSGGYVVHLSQQWAGFRRVIGSFSEPATFGSHSFQFFVAMFCLWYQRWGGRIVTFSMLGNLAMLVASTSTTAYAGFVVFALSLPIWLAIALAGGRVPRKTASLLIVSVPLLLFISALAISQAVPAGLYDVLDLTLRKGDSASAIERGIMNAQAWRNFIETSGLGVGLGSARASSFLLVILSNIGVLGALLFSIFVLQLLAPGTSDGVRMRQIAWSMARGMALAMLVVDCISGGVFDLTAKFYIICGVWAASKEARYPAADHGPTSVGLPSPA